MIYKFIDNQGTFTVKNPQNFSYLYFPLTDKNGSLLSSVSPNLSGDIKRDNHSFLTPPASIEDLKHNPLCRRDFFLLVHGRQNRLLRCSQKADDTLEAGLLYHKLYKKIYPFQIEIINFIPHDLGAEVMWIKIKNRGGKTVSFSPCSFIPLYGRGEPNLHDHRHVSSLLNRVELSSFGLTLCPTMIFDEKGHRKNFTRYFSFGYEKNGLPPQGQYPTLLSFCGEGGDLSFPEAVLKGQAPFKQNSPAFQGKENCAALRFQDRTLKPGQETDYILISGISESRSEPGRIFKNLDSPAKVSSALNRTKKYWQNSLSLKLELKDKNYTNWLKWVQVQPTLRTLFGCSFLPHFDYGKGGRGFRDLWQDCLGLLLKDEPGIDRLIRHNFKSLRIDGSNATIIAKDGSFLSDRNKISRVWTDHGVWPLLTTGLYLNRSRDLNLLLQKTSYFKDHLLKRAKETDPDFQEKDYLLRDNKGKIYKGTILEHLLIQNTIQFFNLGKHNNLRLENGDWNDGLDMAANKGESVPFFCMYAANLAELSRLLSQLEKKEKKVLLLEETLILFDSLNKKIDYNKVKAKQNLLETYLEKTKNSVSGKLVSVDISALKKDLTEKANWIFDHVRKQEWLDKGFYNGYYDNSGQPVEGRQGRKTRIMLQSQVFPILSKTATDKQVKKIWKSVNRYLKDKDLGGFRLNTDFQDICLDFGRAFGFSYGDKENGAFFNHMIVMFGYALFYRGFIKEGNQVFSSLFSMSASSESRMYPQLPEYFNSSGRGLYFYLTGSASWYIYTLCEQVMGITFSLGDLILAPKLQAEVFTSDTVSISFPYCSRQFKVIYKRSKKTKKYLPSKAFLNKKELALENSKLILSRKTIAKLSPQKEHIIQVELI